VEVQFKIKPAGSDVTEIVTAGLVDVIAWEDHYARPSSSLSGDDVFARDFVWLAWHAQKRQGKTSLEFMDWVATLDDIEGTETTLVPLENPVVTGSSPASP